MTSQSFDSLLARFEAVLGPFLPDEISLTLTRWNLKYSYGPIAAFLERKVAPSVPLGLSPDHVTYLSLACLVPCALLVRSSSAALLLLCALLVAVHDLLDRLDGCVARYRSSKKLGTRTEEQGRWGSFLDAQCDKVFHVLFLVALLTRSGSAAALGPVWVLLALAMIALQGISFVVRYADFYHPPSHPLSIKSAGEGKLATTFCNSAALTASVALSGLGPSFFAGLTCVFLVLALDLALRSVCLKLKARSQKNQKNSLLEAVTWLYDTVHKPYGALFASLAAKVPARIHLRVLGAKPLSTMVLHTVEAFLAIPLAFAVRFSRFSIVAFLVALFHLMRTFTHVVEKGQTATKLATNTSVNRSQFYSACSAQIFYIMALFAVAITQPSGIVSLPLQVVGLFYAAAWLAIRIDDSYPKMSATGSSYARVGGFGTRFGVSMRGKLREKLQLVSIILLATPSGSWWRPLGLACLCIVTFLSHTALRHKMAFRAKLKSKGKAEKSLLVKQDESLKESGGGQYDVMVSLGCFDSFHSGHIKLLKRMRAMGKKLIVGVHDDESIHLLKGRYPVDNTVRRLRNVKQYADVVYCVPSVDPTTFIDCVIDRSVPKERMCFVRGDDMPQFPGRPIVEQLMEIKLTPYTEGVSSTMLREKLIQRAQEAGVKDENDDDEWIRFNHAWVRNSDLPPGCSFLRYGDSYYIYRTEESSPTIS